MLVQNPGTSSGRASKAAPHELCSKKLTGLMKDMTMSPGSQKEKLNDRMSCGTQQTEQRGGVDALASQGTSRKISHSNDSINVITTVPEKLDVVNTSGSRKTSLQKFAAAHECGTSRTPKSGPAEASSGLRKP